MMHLIPDWKDLWRFWSVQATVALGLWNMVPVILQERIPVSVNLGVSTVLLASVVLARIVNQPKLNKGGRRDPKA